MYAPFVGLIFICIGFPFYLEKIAPNSISGVRLPQTRANPEAWYAINKIFGLDMIIAGIILMLISVSVLISAQWYPSLPTDKINVSLILLCLAGVVAHVFFSLK